VDDPGRDRIAVAFPQAVENLPAQGGVPAGAGGFDGLVSLAQDRDDVPGPVLDAGVIELRRLALAPTQRGQLPAWISRVITGPPRTLGGGRAMTGQVSR
jgi:hypothetical protein